MAESKGRRDAKSLNVFLPPWETERGCEGGVGVCVRVCVGGGLSGTVVAGGEVSLHVSVFRRSKVMQMVRQTEGKAE